MMTSPVDESLRLVDVRVGDVAFADDAHRLDAVFQHPARFSYCIYVLCYCQRSGVDLMGLKPGP